MLKRKSPLSAASLSLLLLAGRMNFGDTMQSCTTTVRQVQTWWCLLLLLATAGTSRHCSRALPLPA